MIDLPAGLAGDGPGTEELVTAARRELLEETGYDARRLTLLAHAPTSPGLTTEVVSFFRAAGLKKVAAGGGIEGETDRGPRGQIGPGRRLAASPQSGGNPDRLQGFRRTAFRPLKTSGDQSLPQIRRSWLLCRRSSGGDPRIPLGRRWQQVLSIEIEPPAVACEGQAGAF